MSKRSNTTQQFEKRGWRTAGVAIVAAFLSIASQADAQTVWSSNTIVGSNLTIMDTLIVMPGVEVSVAAGVSITIGMTGTLDVRGTADLPVRFTASSASRWNGLTFTAGSKGSLTHTIIEKTNNIGIRIFDASPTIESCTIQDILGSSTGATAHGIYATGTGSRPVIRHTIIHTVVGASGGGTGSTGSPGTNGPAGTNGTFLNRNGGTGGTGGQGGAGGTGVPGGHAYGLRIEDSASTFIAFCSIGNIRGGNGAQGGLGGIGGHGGIGGIPYLEFPFFGNGGNGGNGGKGGTGGAGTIGGNAIGIQCWNQVATSIVYQNLIHQLVPGFGGQGGRGGNGGGGGNGNGGVTCGGIPLCTGSNGGNGGNGGARGNGGNAGAGGAAIALNIQNIAPLTLAQNTIVNVAQAAGGSGGLQGLFGGSGGLGGQGGSSTSGPNGTNGNNGSTGGVGTNGQTGNAGDRFGVNLTLGTAAVTIRNNIFAFAAPVAGTAIQNSSTGAVSADYNCFWNHATLSGGTVALSNILLANPQFVNTAGGDYRLAAGSPCVNVAGAALAALPPIEYERDGMGWRSAASWGAHGIYAFDEFYPGNSGPGGCLAGSPATLTLQGGSVTIRVLNPAGKLQCAIVDGATGPAMSDVVIDGAAGTRARFDFSPPISAFHIFYGSLAINGVGTMRLYSGGFLVGELAGAPSPHAINASGHGFLSPRLIDRVEVTITGDVTTVLGAFAGLAAGDTSIGSVVIPGYTGPTGANVLCDFGVVFGGGDHAYDLDGEPRLFGSAIDLGAYERNIPTTILGDLNNDGIVGAADLGILLGSWSVPPGSPGCSGATPCPADLNNDGTVGAADLGILLGAWTS